METQKFERLGIFTYSQEKGSAAADLSNQVPEAVKQKRLERAMLLQQKISAENNKKWLGKNLKVLIDEQDETDTHLWRGRSFMDAPEVDGSVLIHSQKPLQPGQFVNARITETEEYDLVGRVS